MRRPVPLFAHGLWDNGEFSELKHVPTENGVAYPWENETATPEKFTFKCACYSYTINETKYTHQMSFSSSLPGGNKSFSLCALHRLAVEGLNNQSLYIILHPAGLLDAAIMAC